MKKRTLTIAFVACACALIVACSVGLSPLPTAEARVAKNHQVATPQFSPTGGNYGVAQDVTISTTTTEGHPEIYYTTDGSTPAESTGLLYAGPIKVSSTLTLKAIAVKTGWTDSDVASATYVIPTYYTDFSSDPGWTTSDASRFYWDSGLQAYFMNRININGGGNYAIKDVGVNMTGRSFRLEWDILMKSVDYACDLRFGLFDTDMNGENGSYAWVDFTLEDRGYTIQMSSMGSDNVFHGDGTTRTTYSLDTWYHVVMSYDSTTGQLSASITDRGSGSLVRTLSTTTSAFAADMDRVGISDIRQGNYQVAGAQARGYVDNVALYVY